MKDYKLDELFPHLQLNLNNVVECICIDTYIFNNTVIFHKGETYPVDLKKKEDSDLLAVIQPEYPAYVGMSESRFAEYFQMKEQNRSQESKIKSMPIYQLSNIIDDNFIINIVKEYGSTNQGIVLMEELNELCTEIIKRKNSNNKNQIAEEIAHCMISFCTYSTAYNFNWDIHKTPDIQIYSEPQFILNLLDLQKEISKKLRGKDNDDILCEKIGLCFSELQKCMYHYVISWDMIREEVSKKVSKYQSIKIKQDLSYALSVDIERE